MSLSNEQIIEAISSKTLVEVMELVKAMEEKFGVSAAAPVAVSAGPAAAGAAAAEEQTEFTVNLKSAGEKKVEVIKVVRAITGLRSEEHTSELQSLMRTSYAVFCLKKIPQDNPQEFQYINRFIYT